VYLRVDVNAMALSQNNLKPSRNLVHNLRALTTVNRKYYLIVDSADPLFDPPYFV